jgi:hypothetical protein
MFAGRDVIGRDNEAFGARRVYRDIYAFSGRRMLRRKSLNG